MKPSVTINVDHITIHPGETLTVWLDSGTRSEGRNAVQIELRVDWNGKREVFYGVNNGGVSVNTFHQWGPMERSMNLPEPKLPVESSITTAQVGEPSFSKVNGD